MSSPAWHARIECGNEVGAGFLVAARRVLTCAHVVRQSGTAEVTVSFPHRRELGALPAIVEVRGGWAGGAADPGDLAVLELDREIPLAPAVFAPPGTEHASPSPVLVAYGFPAGYDEGTLARYQAVSRTRIADEWVELEAVTAHGQPLAAGFSGAALALDDGRVVGMVSAIAGEKDVKVGRMLPIQVMTRYWPDLLSLVTASHRAVTERTRLHELVERAARRGLKLDPARLYNGAAGPYDPPVPREGFNSLEAAARFVLDELDVQHSTDTVTRFADQLEAQLGAGEARPRTNWSSILFEFRRSGAGDDEVCVEVSAFSDGRRHPVASDTVPRPRLRAYVHDRLQAAILHLAPGAEELLAFSLPRDWLDWPVDTWPSGPENDTPLGCVHPLVVTDHARRVPTIRHALTQAWGRLASRTSSRMEPVPCDGRLSPRQLQLRLWDPDSCCAGFATTPRTARTRDHFACSVTTPAPVIAWSRSGCGPKDTAEESLCPGADGCTGTAFLDRFGEWIAQVPPSELPRHVRELRRAAYATDTPDGHWARDIQLLWDDPRWFTDSLAAAIHSRSPVA
ncbi:trypsin-like peptidase domain-containing protein [Streptomyces sp. NPDC001797]|uniref:VMAP-C domain-containing protein n=1 Tax=Streptomyces sp. NPDC001797 TaxID=3364610 RepID=UPI0036CF3D83